VIDYAGKLAAPPSLSLVPAAAPAPAETITAGLHRNVGSTIGRYFIVEKKTIIQGWELGHGSSENLKISNGCADSCSLLHFFRIRIGPIWMLPDSQIQRMVIQSQQYVKLYN